MTRIRTALIAVAFGLIAFPALANGISVNLPRLQFPAADGAIQSCQNLTTQVCLPDRK